MPAPPKKRKSAAKRFALYWCTTDDGSEDWFVVAASGRQAAKFHEGNLGYDPGDADVELVMHLPPELHTETMWRNGPNGPLDTAAAWASDELLVACGAEIGDVLVGRLGRKLGDVGKAVQLAGRVFRAGSVVETVAVSFGDDGARLSVFGGSKRTRSRLVGMGARAHAPSREANGGSRLYRDRPSTDARACLVLSSG